MWLWLALLALFLFGTQKTLATIPSRWTDWEDTARVRIPMVLTGGTIGYQVMRAFLQRPWRVRRWRAAILLCGIGLAGRWLMFSSLDAFASFSRVALFYPVAAGTCTTAFALYSIFILEERVTVTRTLGMGFGCVGVVLVLL
jgi:multidrug transporter EmrE-like cation transporter